MKIKLVAAVCMGLTMSTGIVAADAPALSTDMDKLSYSVGIDLGKNLKRQGIEINPTVMAKGIQDGGPVTEYKPTSDRSGASGENDYWSALGYDA